MAECVRERPKQKTKNKKIKEATNDDKTEAISALDETQNEAATTPEQNLPVEQSDDKNINANDTETSTTKLVTGEISVDPLEQPDNDSSSKQYNENEKCDDNSLKTDLQILETSISMLETTTIAVESDSNLKESEHQVVDSIDVEPSAPPPSLDTTSHTQPLPALETSDISQPQHDKSEISTHKNENTNIDIKTNVTMQSVTPKETRTIEQRSIQNYEETRSSVMINQNFQSVRPRNQNVVAKTAPSIYENVELNKHRESEKETTAVGQPQSIRPRSFALTNMRSAKEIIKTRVSNAQAATQVVAFTEQQLNYFYYNAELQQIDYFVDEFLKNSDKQKHEFYELILFYYKSRKRLAEILDEIQTLQTQVKSDREKAWTIKQFTLTAEGTCGCNVKVQGQQIYQQAYFEKDISARISNRLFKIRDIVHKTLPLEFYNSQVARLRIENYLSKLFKSSAALIDLNSSLPVSALLPANIGSKTIPVLCQLQDCITALFVFKRYGVLEEAFSKDVDYWLGLLVAALQRIGTLPDSFFLLNHLLRCPPSTVPKICNFIQFPTFLQPTISIGKWNSPLIHHFVVMLATLTLPVRSRKKFLSKFKVNIKNPQLNRGISWTLVDEDNEENENDEDSWSLMMEVDLTSIFEQFPFTELLVYALNIERRDGALFHNPANSCSNDLMGLFALATCVIELLGKIFDTYNLLRYRQFLKCISRTIRLLTQVVSDHWLAYRSYRLDVVGDLPHMLPADVNNSIPQFSLDKLQVEFDQIFLKASKRILSSHSSGAIQFLSTMPFEAIKLQSVWVMMTMILNQEKDLPELLRESGPDNIPPVRFLEVSPSEGIFLLTALSNMAISRTNHEDQQLIETIAVQILEISFLNTSLVALYSKNGRDFLAMISSKHPFVISALQEAVDHQKNDLREVMTYIFEALPLDLWQPKPNDLERIRGWLLECPFQSEENKLARLMLSKLNFDTDRNNFKPFLPRVYHYAIAVLIVEAFGVAFPDFPGGIQKLDDRNVGIIAQVGKMAISSYTKITQSRAHAEFMSWAWYVLLKLKLHESDVFQRNEDEENTADVRPQELAKMNWTGQILTELSGKRSHEFDIELTPKLINVNLALKSNGLLASYVAFAMTKESHFADMFLNKGTRYLLTLNDWYQYDAVVKMIQSVVSVFLNCPEQLIVESFVQVMNKLIHVDVDRAGYTEKIWQYFIAGTYSQKLAALVTSQVLKGKRHSVDQALKMISFWLFIFLKMPLWVRDCGVLFQIDSLCKVASIVTGGLLLIEDVLYDEYKKLIKSQEPRGLLSSVMSWISTGQHISLMPSPSSDFCYFASTVLAVEQRFEEEIGLWKELGMEISANSKVPLEETYKKCTSSIKSLYIPSLSCLSIYRHGQQAMVTPSDHPFLPIIWKQFFVLFLRKPTGHSGLPSRTGVGAHFFTSFSIFSTLKKMKTALQSSASYHQEKSAALENPTSERVSVGDKEHHHSQEFHQKLASLYQGLSLWLEESRLHDPNLYIDALPDAYIPELLVKVFQGNQEVWYSYVNGETIQRELDTLSELWSNASPKTDAMQVHPNDDVMIQGTCGQRIIRRLSGESAPRPPPEVIRPETPVDEPSLHIILTQPRLFQVINHDLQRIVQYAKSSSILSASHVGLDTEFLEMLPDLYEMITHRTTLQVSCDGRKRKDGCKSPAQIAVKVDELRLRERVQHLLDDNRTVFDQLLTNSRNIFPEDLCIGTVHVENIIEKLSEAFLSLNSSRKEELQQNASKLFYLLAELIDDDVKRCYPAIQFFSSGVEVLGKAYIADTPSEQLKLLETILTHNSSVMFLAPYFYPMTALVQFVELYTKMVSFMQNDILTTIFVLLSKFDVQTWLTKQPTRTKINELLVIVLRGITNLGYQPNSEGLVVLEIFRDHMMLLLASDVNESFYSTLSELLTSSSSTSISPLCWEDFLGALRFNDEVSTVGTTQRPPQQHCLLSMDHVKEALDYLAEFFQSSCAGVNYELETFYIRWEPYVKSLSILVNSLFRHFVRYSMSTIHTRAKDVVLKELWEHVLAVYKPWIIPQSIGKIWTLLRVDNVLTMLQSFTDVIRLIIDLSIADATAGDFCFILNQVLTFYLQYILPTVREQQSLELFNGMFVTLPWLHFCPSIQDMTFVMKVYTDHRGAFPFYCGILLQVDWSAVAASYDNSGSDRSMIAHFHHLLLNIILMFTTSNTILDSTSTLTKLTALLESAASLQWSCLVLEDTARTCQWYGQTANYELILDKESILWSALNFLQKVIGYTSPEQELSQESLAPKRNIYVQTVTTLLTRCSSLKDTVSEVKSVLEILLSTIDSAVVYNTSNPMQELVLHCSTFLSMLNNVSPGLFTVTVKSCMESHLLSTSCGMTILAFISAASTSVAQLHEMVAILENVISMHFHRLNDDELSNSWVPIMHAFVVPELSKDDFVAEAIRQNAFLTLYALNLRRLSQVTSQHEQYDVMVDSIQWCSKPQLDQNNEVKLLLLFLQIFDIVRCQLVQFQYSKEELRSLGKYMMFLSASSQSQGEDKTYSGMLGAIGIGRKSGLTKEFRLTSKAVHLFLTCQLPSALTPIRHTPESPGAIRNSPNKSARATTEAEKAFISFQNLVKSNTYQPMREQIDWVIKFVADPNTTIQDGCSLVAYLCKSFFHKQNFIAASLT